MPLQSMVILKNSRAQAISFEIESFLMTNLPSRKQYKKTATNRVNQTLRDL
jgi:hypothetical protein